MVSIFNGVFSSKPERHLDILSYFDGIKNGQWQDEVLSYRVSKEKKVKERLPCVTTSGKFENKKDSEILEHSGVICIDIDAKDQIIEINIERLKNDDYTFCVHQSVSGFGYALYVKIDSEKHLDAFLGLEAYFMEKYSIVIDKSCKNLSRLRFCSYDPFLYLNEKSKVFKKYLPKKLLKPTNKPFVVKSDFDEMVVEASKMNLFDDYQDYIKLAFALSDEFGVQGLGYFLKLASSSPKFNQEKAEKDFNKAVSRGKTGVTIASVYHIFKENGIKLTSEKTETIKSIAKLSDKPKEKLKELGIEDTDGIVEDVIKSKKNNKTEIDLIIDLIKMEKIIFNTINRNFEWNGVLMDDRLLAKFYTCVWQKIDEGISKDKIFTLLQNRDNTESVNPILDFFEKNKNITTNNEFEKVKQCLKISNNLVTDKGETLYFDDYLDVYLKKWLLGIIGSAHGTYSLMVLVLVGEQGVRKTEFFRNLLPDELTPFYAESNLDEGKDSEILMTKKLLIVDDEFGGKSKKDATKLKRLSSQQTFSIRSPYGRFSEDLMRLAVLGGTSNEMEVINDPTGNRRIIPLNVISLDFEKYKEINKTKLFIELYNEWKKNPLGWFLTPKEISYLNQTTQQNTDVMAEEEIINKIFVPSPHSKMTSTDVFLKIEEVTKGLKTNLKRVGQALKKCGYEQKLTKLNGKVYRFYDIIAK